jgi:hypothetical protein
MSDGGEYVYNEFKIFMIKQPFNLFFGGRG